MAKIGKTFSLGVTLAAYEGHYLSGGSMVVRDDAGKMILEVSDTGPITYVDLEPRAYTLVVDVAGFPGEKEERTVEIGDNQVTGTFARRTE